MIHHINRFLNWVALSDKLPEHESAPEFVNLWSEFRRVIKESGIDRREEVASGFRPFSYEVSKWLRSVKKKDEEQNEHP